MRKIAILLIAFGLLLSLLIFNFESVSADMEKPVFSEGDYWEYDVVYSSDATGTARWEVKSEDNITINGTNYDGILMEFNESSYSASYPAGPIHTNGVGYITLSNHSMVKSFFNSTNDFQLSQITSTSETLSSDNQNDWPLKVGGSRRTTTKTNAIWSITNLITGNISYNNYTETSETYTVCEGITNVETPAGIFECYIKRSLSGYPIEENDIGNSSYSYYSSRVGSYVKQVQYIDGEIVSVYNLTSYKYSASGTSDNTTDKGKSEDKGIPGFELIFVVCAIALILVWKRKRKL
jgi:hypothetical protein